MAFPTDIFICAMVQYVPAPFDSLYAFGPVISATITAIDTEAEIISLTVFPPDRPPLYRKEVKYYDATGTAESGFKRPSDPYPLPEPPPEL